MVSGSVSDLIAINCTKFLFYRKTKLIRGIFQTLNLNFYDFVQVDDFQSILVKSLTNFLQNCHNMYFQKKIDIIFWRDRKFHAKC